MPNLVNQQTKVFNSRVLKDIDNLLEALKSTLKKKI